MGERFLRGASVASLIAVSMVLPVVDATAVRAAGGLDPTFSGDGIVELDPPAAQAAHITETGRVVVASVVGDGVRVQFFDQSGDPVLSFSGDGETFVRWSSPVRAVSPAIAVGSSRAGLVVAATTESGRIGLARFRLDGVLDVSFAASFDGRGRRLVAAPATTVAIRMRIDRFHRIDLLLTALYHDPAPWLETRWLRFKSSGDLMPFESGGSLRLGRTVEFTARNDGRVMVVDQTGAGVFRLHRLDTSGRIDRTFSGDGRLEFKCGSETWWVENLPYSVHVDTSGRVVVRCRVGRGPTHLRRWTKSGVLDPTFGEGGALRLASPATTVLIDDEDRVVLLAEHRTDAVYVGRLTLRGWWDDSFVPGGHELITLPAAAHGADRVELVRGDRLLLLRTLSGGVGSALAAVAMS